MALRPEELDRIKWELGVPLTRIGAEPYIAYMAIWDKVIQPFLFDNGTTSTTPVVAATNGANVQVTLASNPAAPNNNGLTFQVGTAVIVDVGPAQEQSTVLALAGLSATLNLTSAHGTGAVSYPIVPYGSEQIVRDILTRLDTIKSELTNIAPLTAGIEAGDQDIKLATARRGRGQTLDKFQVLIAQRDQARDDLGDAIGFPNLRKAKKSGNSRFELY